jgi:hypothetical protein
LLTGLGGTSGAVLTDFQRLPDRQESRLAWRGRAPDGAVAIEKAASEFKARAGNLPEDWFATQ